MSLKLILSMAAKFSEFQAQKSNFLRRMSSKVYCEMGA